VIVHIVSWLPEIAFHQLWLGVLVAGVAWLALRWRCAWTAGSRYWLWSGVLAVIALLPLAMMVPKDSLVRAAVSEPPAAALPGARAQPVAAPAPNAANTTVAGVADAIRGVAARPNAAAPGAASPRPHVPHSLAALLVFIWLTVVACKLSSLAHGFAVLRQWRRHAVPVRVDFETCDVMESKDVTTPMVVGVLRPCILLPPGLREQLTPEQLAFVLAHECAHIRRGDPAMALVQKLIATMYCYNPVVHWVSRQIERERECSCDDIAVGHAQDREGYAGSLIAVARHIVGAPQPHEALGAIGGPPQLRHRIERLLDPGEPRRTWLSRAAMGVTTAALVAIVALFSPVIPVAQAANGDVDTDARLATARGSGRALVEAAGNGDVATVRALIDGGADIDYAARGDGTALMMAARRSDEHLVQLLIERGANVNVPSRGDGNALILASARASLDIVKLLVERGADVNAYVPGDETPLINAARAGRVDVVNYLVTRGADVNLAVAANEWPATEMRSPLSEARRLDRQAVVERLMELGAR
jgi:bla regulator protein blaR1